MSILIDTKKRLVCFKNFIFNAFCHFSTNSDDYFLACHCRLQAHSHQVNDTLLSLKPQQSHLFLLMTTPFHSYFLTPSKY